MVDFVPVEFLLVVDFELELEFVVESEPAEFVEWLRPMIVWFFAAALWDLALVAVGGTLALIAVRGEVAALVLDGDGERGASRVRRALASAGAVSSACALALPLSWLLASTSTS